MHTHTHADVNSQGGELGHVAERVRRQRADAVVAQVPVYTQTHNGFTNTNTHLDNVTLICTPASPTGGVRRPVGHAEALHTPATAASGRPAPWAPTSACSPPGI